jgi:protein SCO1/2
MKHLLTTAFALMLALTASAENSSTPPQLPGKVGIAQHLDAKLPLDLIVRDEAGRIHRLGSFFKPGRPVLLNFVYYRCPMLCSLVLEDLTSALTELKFDVGKEFDVITVSIDPRDMPEKAAAKKEMIVKRYGRPSAWEGWHFLTANESAIRRLTGTVGFEYAYDIKTDQFAHGTTLLVITPDGRVSRYLNGFEYKPRDIRLGLVEASQGKIGTVSDTLLLLCFHYDPVTGKYSKTAMNIVRAGGVATVLSLAGFIFIMLRNERRAPSPAASRHPLPAERGEGSHETLLPAVRGEGGRRPDEGRENQP